LSKGCDRLYKSGGRQGDGGDLSEFTAGSMREGFFYGRAYGGLRSIMGMVMGVVRGEGRGNVVRGMGRGWSGGNGTRDEGMQLGGGSGNVVRGMGRGWSGGYSSCFTSQPSGWK
jgi:hypothetical protein